MDTINTELLLSDMEILERRIQRTAKAAKADKKIQPELDLLQRVYEWLGEGKNARAMDLDEDEAAFVKTLDLLSYKPVIYVANVSEEDAASAVSYTHLDVYKRQGVFTYFSLPEISVRQTFSAVIGH